MCGFSCFKKLFIIVNEEEKYLQIMKDEQISVYNISNLIGIESLWQIAF